MTMKITVQKTTKPKPKPDPGKLGFGKIFTDHQFMMDYIEGKGWHNPRIVPYGPISMDPATMVLHYGQAIFEGMKAYRTADGRVLLFRPRKNMERVNSSSDRMCIPPIDPDFCVEAIKALIKVDQDWVPAAADTSLYIRPLIIAMDPFLGVRAAATYLFLIILSPVGAYYPQGINPVKIHVESEYVRAVKGGTGFAKFIGNYAGSLKAQMEAAKNGYVQVLWLDGIERKYVEEVGAMNVFFKIGGQVVTAPLAGTILPGVTRDSVLQLLRRDKVPVEERKYTIQEVYDAHDQGRLDEAFGTGTAAVISPIGVLHWNGRVIKINDEKTGPLAKKLYDTLTGIQYGRLKDEFGWTDEVK